MDLMIFSSVGANLTHEAGVLLVQGCFWDKPYACDRHSYIFTPTTRLQKD